MAKFWLIVLISVVSMDSFAKKGEVVISRGGLGFLFPDANDFSNPSQFASTDAVAFELKYQQLADSADQTFVFSGVGGTGLFGFGVYGIRLGTNLGKSENSTDYAGIGLGMNFFKKHLSLGIGYDTMVDAGRVNDGSVKIAANLFSSRRTGPALGVGYTRTVNNPGGESQSAKVSLGYLIMNMVFIELGGYFPDVNTLSDYEATAAFSLIQKFWYFAFAYKYIKLDNSQFAYGRLGIIVLDRIDFSFFANREVAQSGQTEYGGTLRYCF